jgi:hypothetical protein
MQRPETNIAVVTHSAFLWFTLTCFGNEFAKPVRENLQRWYEVGEGGGAVRREHACLCAFVPVCLPGLRPG